MELNHEKEIKLAQTNFDANTKTLNQKLLEKDNIIKNFEEDQKDIKA